MLDLTDGMLDSHLVLSGDAGASNGRPDIFMSLNGALAAPQKSTDVSALTGWLTLRAVENQAKKLKALEEAEAKRRAEEAKRIAEEEARRRAVLEEKRRLEEARREAEAQARARAEDEAKLRSLTEEPSPIPVLAPAGLPTASKPQAAPNSPPAEAVSSIKSEAKAAPTGNAAPQKKPAPALPPPVTIKRAPAPSWNESIH
jgi:hypothetical protein